MMTNHPDPSRDRPVVVWRHEHPTHTEWFLTGLPPPRLAGADAPDGSAAGSDATAPAAQVFEAIAAIVAAEGIAVLQEKIYAVRSAHGSIRRERSAALARAGVTEDWPMTLLEGTPATGKTFGGVQLWGVTAGADQRVETVFWRGRMLGREWSGPDFRALLLASVDGIGSGDPVEVPAVRSLPTPEQTAPPFDEARRMFEEASAALAARGFSYRQVARTWIYLPHILDCYASFNRVRNAHYAAAGLSAAGGAFFPASTGIQARHDREECLMDLLAIEAPPGGRVAVRPIARSDRQGEAVAYGSAFARAMVIERAGRKIIHVSGTASIDDAGRSTHPDDGSAQYCETLLSIAAVLEREGATLADVAQGTLFTKTPAIAQTCRDATRRLGLQPLPLVEIIADVCRPELLVEIEAVALVGDRQAAC